MCIASIQPKDTLKEEWFVSFSWPRKAALLCSGGGGILDPNSYDSGGTICFQEMDLEMNEPSWGCCPMGFCLRESLAFRTVIPLVLPSLLKKVTT